MMKKQRHDIQQIEKQHRIQYQTDSKKIINKCERITWKKMKDGNDNKSCEKNEYKISRMEERQESKE